MTDRWETRALAILVGSLALLYVAVATEDNAVVWLDLYVHEYGLHRRWPQFFGLANLVELLGQRGVVYPVAVVLTGALAWSLRRWRPLVLLACSLLALNVIVGASKVITGRQKPFYGVVELFSGGTMFPSGHAANVVLVWGLLAYLLVRYGERTAWRAPLALTVVAAALAMGAASTYLDTHWVSDILAGWLVGAVILQATVMLDGRPADELVFAGRSRLPGRGAQRS